MWQSVAGLVGFCQSCSTQRLAVVTWSRELLGSKRVPSRAAVTVTAAHAVTASVPV